ncbi:MAG: acyl-CoA thioesterase [Actinomycetota bacterium]|nr:acyl-CoA thioesterase [Nocardioidaceae bacterium]MDQ3592430.1 acyl-CoA thioesterase [Actinomycetota bacterium]
MVRHVVELKPRWADMDAYGHVNNVTWLEYLQEARVDMFFTHAPQRGTDKLVEGVVVSRAEIDYLRPLIFRPEPVRIEMWVSKVTAASFTVEYEVLDVHADGARTVYARAATVLVPITLGDGRPRRVTVQERTVLAMLRE